MSQFLIGLLSFTGYLAASAVFCVAFIALYVRLTPHREFDLMVREHNASAAVSLAGALIGFAIVLAGALRNTRSPGEFAAWALVGALAQAIAYRLARLTHANLSQAIEQNAIAAAIWLASVSIAAGILCAACMGP